MLETEGKERSEKCVCNKSNRKGTPSQTSYTCETGETSRMKAKRKEEMKGSRKYNSREKEMKVGKRGE